MDQKLFEHPSHVFLKKPGGRSESAWLQMADALQSVQLDLHEEKSLVDEVLKQTPAGKKNLVSYRSKVLDLTHPTDPKAFEAARNAQEPRIGINDLIAIARGSKSFQNGEAVVVSKSAAGGWNKTPATQKIREGINSAFAAAKDGGIPIHEVKLIFNKCLHRAEAH
jgi:hypothetical protein